MSIGFDATRWDQVKEVAREWWAGRLKRPIIQIRLQDCDPQRPAPRHPFLGFTARYPASVTPEEIVDVWDYDLAKTEYLGDAFPNIWPNFGPGIIAGFLGARVKPEEHTFMIRCRCPAKPRPKRCFAGTALFDGCGHSHLASGFPKKPKKMY